MNLPHSMRFGCCGSMISPATDPIGVEIIESLAQIGFDYIELSLADLASLSGQNFSDVKRRIGQSGISCEACNNFFPPRIRLTGPEAQLPVALEYAIAAMDRAAELGVRIVVFGSAGAKNVPTGFSTDKAWKQIVELLQNLGPVAAQRGITIAIEPLNKLESNIINRASEGLALVKAVAHPNIQLLIDYYHLMMEKEDAEIVLKAGPAIRHVHFAQVAGRVFPKQIDSDVERFADFLRRVGYAGRCSIEAYSKDFDADAPSAHRLLERIFSGTATPQIHEDWEPNRSAASIND